MIIISKKYLISRKWKSIDGKVSIIFKKLSIDAIDREL